MDRVSTLTIGQTFPSSHLSRHSAEVFSAADAAPVQITRRDGESLTLLRTRELKMHERALNVAAQLIAASVGPSADTFVRRLRQPFPWLAFLPAADQETFATEIVDVARASFAIGDFGPLLRELSDWHSTARAHASGMGDGEVQWLDEDTP